MQIIIHFNSRWRLYQIYGVVANTYDHVLVHANYKTALIVKYYNDKFTFNLVWNSSITE